MRLVTFAQGDAQQGGVVIGERVYPFADLGLPGSVVELLALEDAGVAQLAAAVASPTGEGRARSCTSSGPPT